MGILPQKARSYENFGSKLRIFGIFFRHVIEQGFDLAGVETRVLTESFFEAIMSPFEVFHIVEPWKIANNGFHLQHLHLKYILIH